jgi:AcrR family transcriptional regulator
VKRAVPSATAHISTPSAPRQPKQARAQQTANAILEAAGLVLVEVGYSRATTNAIAVRAGISIGSLYQYFRDKEDIYRTMKRRHLEHIEPLAQELIERLVDPENQVSKEIGRFVAALVDQHEPSRDLLCAMDRELGWLDMDEFGGSQERATWTAVTYGLLRTRAPKIRAPKEAAHLLIASVELLSRWIAHFAPRELDRGALVDNFESMVEGLLRGGPKRG